MAIKLSANYSKKLGLPQYSSHSFSASVEVELTDITQVEQEIQKLYELLQHSVDQEIQNVGFVPQGQRSKHGKQRPNLPTQQQRTHLPSSRQQRFQGSLISLLLLVMPGTAPMASGGSSCASSVTTRWKSRKPKICPAALRYRRQAAQQDAGFTAHRRSARQSR
jgi:hypothetical protein